MKILIFSDLHANFPALRYIENYARHHSIDAIYCLGDIVGYHPYPRECIDWFRTNEIPCLKGNHEAIVTGELNEWDRISERARHTLLRTQQILNKEEKAYLEQLPFSMQISENIILLHANYSDLKKTVNTTGKAAEQFRYAQQQGHRIVFFGHTHRPGGFVYHSQTGEVHYLNSPKSLTLEKDCFYLINPGSCGEPRHGFSPSFLTFDTENHHIHFVYFALDKEAWLRLKSRSREVFGGFSLKRLPAQAKEKLLHLYYKLSG